jgi:hypothetical protein
VVKAQGNRVLRDFVSLSCWVLCLLGLFCGLWVYFSFFSFFFSFFSFFGVFVYTSSVL